MTELRTTMMSQLPHSAATDNCGDKSTDCVLLQVLSNVLGVVPWVIDFIVDSGWAQEIVRYQELPLHDIEALA